MIIFLLFYSMQFEVEWALLYIGYPNIEYMQSSLKNQAEIHKSILVLIILCP